jgi:anti-sigma regulatory factor (Ser/Thr protein kinase)
VIRLNSTVNVTDATSVAAARRSAIGCGESLGFSETASATAGLVATELATNLIKHAVTGTIVLGQETGSVVMIALDKGRGIPSIRTALEDGYSTAGSPGTGLGAIARAASELDIFTMPDRGTAVYCRIEDSRQRTETPFARPMLIAAGINIPKSGEQACGDDWGTVRSPPPPRKPRCARSPIAARARCRCCSTTCTARCARPEEPPSRWRGSWPGSGASTLPASATSPA